MPALEMRYECGSKGIATALARRTTALALAANNIAIVKEHAE
jgi:hypothetical protein